MISICRLITWQLHDPTFHRMMLESAPPVTMWSSSLLTVTDQTLSSCSSIVDTQVLDFITQSFIRPSEPLSGNKNIPVYICQRPFIKWEIKKKVIWKEASYQDRSCMPLLIKVTLSTALSCPSKVWNTDHTHHTSLWYS